jgi:hypothetical protein
VGEQESRTSSTKHRTAKADLPGQEEPRARGRGGGCRRVAPSPDKFFFQVEELPHKKEP